MGVFRGLTWFDLREKAPFSCKKIICVHLPRPHLLSAAVSRDGSLRGSSQGCSVVVEIAGRIHLVLQREREKNKQGSD